MSDTFTIVFGARRDPGGEPYSDPLNEFAPDELARLRFCYEQNCQVDISMCSIEFPIDLEPDVAEMIAELPQIVADLQHGKPAWFDFPEVWWSIKFYPDEATTRCVVGGLQRKSTECLLPTTEVIATLRGFVEELTQRMVAGGYLTQAQADDYLAPMQVV